MAEVDSLAPPSHCHHCYPPQPQPHYRILRRPVSFGNPALGTYLGNVYTIEFTNPEQQHGLLFPFPVVEQALSVDRTVAMVDVPPEQVPDGIFNLLRAHRTWIRHLRLVIAGPLDKNDESKLTPDVQEFSQSPTAPAAFSQLRGSAVAASKKESALDKLVSENSNERRYLVLLEIKSDEAAEQLVEDLHGQPYTSLDETCCCSIYHVVALQGQDGLHFPIIDAHSGQITSRQQSQQTGATDSVNAKEPAKVAYALAHVDGENCAVCLEKLHVAYEGSGGTCQETSPVLTTVCNHSFHMDCLLKWQDSSCPVCRYDHSCLNETLSQCHVCFTTENNYVCLICGVVSCGRPSAGPSLVPSSAYDSECAASNNQVSNRIPTNVSAVSHAQQHYDETLHAYALDTETQHVWDFAGQGYVHRLLQNKDDGKLVEVSDPTALSEERTQNPGLSETQEEHLVHEKLEGMANAYYTLLQSQLEQQRIYYEGRLDEIRHDNRPQQASDLIAALKQERHQLSQRLVILESRRNKAREDATFLASMTESLEKNKASLREEVAAAQKERGAIKVMFENCLPALQEKVTRLMLQLEAESTSPAAATQASYLGDSNEKKKASSRRSKN